VGTPIEIKAAAEQLFSFGRSAVDENPEGFDKRVSRGTPVWTPGRFESWRSRGGVCRGMRGSRMQRETRTIPVGTPIKKAADWRLFFSRGRENGKATKPLINRFLDLPISRPFESFKNSS